jgi:hypothetical protein
LLVEPVTLILLVVKSDATTPGNNTLAITSLTVVFVQVPVGIVVGTSVPYISYSSVFLIPKRKLIVFVLEASNESTPNSAILVHIAPSTLTSREIPLAS